jgi:hypothetical protein
MGAQVAPLGLGTGAFIGQLVIVNLNPYPADLFILHQSPDPVGQEITVPDFLVFNQGLGLGRSFGGPDAAYGLTVKFFKAHMVSSIRDFFFKFNIIKAHGK